MALGGTSNHFRVGSLVNVGAWDEWNVTEDADLGIRLARFGYRVETFDSDTWEEAPHELGNWFAQRVRWQKGWMQTLIVHSRHPILFVRDLGFQRALAATTWMVGAILSGLFWPAFAADTLWRALSAGQGDLTPWREASDVFVYILALSGVWAIICSGCRRREAQALQRDSGGACATASILYSFDCSHLDGDVSPRPVAASLGENRPRPKSTAISAGRRSSAQYNAGSLLMPGLRFGFRACGHFNRQA